MNPYRTALGIIGTLALVAGVICITVGNSLNGGYRPTGGGALIWGGALLGFGALAVLLWLVAAAITYSAPTAASAARPREWDEGRDGAFDVL